MTWLLVLLSLNAFAGTIMGGAVQGTLFAPGGTPVTASGVNFKVQVLDKSGTCVMYEESHLGVDLSQTNGDFSFDLGSGTARTNFVSNNTTLNANVYRNDITPLTVTNCSPLTLALTDERTLRVQFDLGSGMVALSPDLRVQGSVYAAVAATVQGKSAADLLQVNYDGSANLLSQNNLNNIFSGTNYPALTSLLAGTSTQYLPTNGSSPVNINGNRLINVAAPGTSPLDGINKGYADSFVAGRVIDTSAIGAGIGGGSTIVWDQAASKWVAGVATAIPSGPAGGDLTGTYPNPTVKPDAITAAKINSTGIAVNRLLITDATTGANVTYATCLPNEILKWTATGWACGTVATLAPVTSVAGKTGAVTLNAIDIAGLGTVVTKDFGSAAGQVPLLGAGGRLPASNLPVDVLYNGGNAYLANVGIGTTTPQAALDVYSNGTAGSAILVPRDTTANRPASAVNGMIRYNSSAAKFEAFENGTWVNVIGGVTSGSSAVFGDGSASAPSISFVGQPTTGFYRNGNAIGIASMGTAAYALGPGVVASIFAKGASVNMLPSTISAPAFSFTGDTSTGLHGYGSGALTLATAGTSRLYVDSLGNVGIGTTSPGANLDVSGSVNASGSLSANTLFSNYGLQFVQQDQGISWPGSVSQIFATGGLSNHVVVATGSTERLRITQSGNVGIGTSTPLAALDVAASGTNSALVIPRDTTANRPAANVANGMIRYNTSTNKFEAYENGAWTNVIAAGGGTTAFPLLANPGTTPATAPSYSFNGSTNTGVYAPASSVIAVSTAGVERLRVDANGAIGINTSTPGVLLDIASPSTGTSDIFRIKSTAGNGGGAMIVDAYSNVIATGFYAQNNSIALSFDNNISTSALFGVNTDTNITAGTNRNILLRPAAGRVGIGTGTPMAMLDVVSTGTNSAIIVPRDTTANRPLVNVTNGMIRYNTSLNAFEGYSNGAWGNLAASGTASAQWTYGTSGGQIYYNSGNVGIGTPSPVTRLDVRGPYVSGAGQLKVTGVSADGYIYADTDTPTTQAAGFGIYKGGSSKWYMSVPANSSDLRFNNGTTDLVTFGSGGFVGIGTTTPSGYGTAGPVLHLKGSATTAPEINLDATSLGGTDWVIVSDAAPTALYFHNKTGGTTPLLMDSSGITVTNQTVSPTVVGSGAASGSLTLDSTYNAVKGKVLIQPLGGNVGIGTTTPQSGLDVATTGTLASAIIVPRDTTTNRPTTAVNGMMRYNSQTNRFEAFENGAWSNMLAAGGGTTSFPLLANPGTTPSTAPSYSFAGDTKTGLYSPAAGSLALATLGTTRLSLLSSGSIETIDGRIAIGWDSQAYGPPTARLQINESSTAIAGENDAVNIKSTILPAGSANADYFGALSYVVHGNNVGNTGKLAATRSAAENLYAATLTTVVGADALVKNSGAGLINSARGIASTVENDSTGTIGTAAAGFFEVKRNAGTISTGYGINIGNVEATTKYSVYASDATAPSYFAGKIGVGTATPQAGLDIATTGTGGSAILIPRDSTANRPSSAVNGMIRYNNSVNAFEGYSNGAWGNLASSGTASAQWTYGSSGQIYYNGGNVGIGQSNPQFPLAIANPSFGGAIGLTRSNASTQDAIISYVPPGGYSLANPRWDVGVFANDSSYKFKVNPGSVVTAMTLDSSGNLAIGPGTATFGAILDIAGTGTAQSSILLPRDNSANRPAGVAGMLRYNTGLNSIEFHNGSAWIVPASNSIGTFSTAATANFSYNNVYAPTSAVDTGPSTAASYGVHSINSGTADGNYAPLKLRATNANTRGQTAVLAAVANSGATIYTPTIVLTQQTGSTSYSERLRIDVNGNLGLSTTTPQAGLDVATTGTGGSAIIVPRDTTANRPTTAVNGMMRYNSQTNKFEAFENNVWTNMIAAGGGTTAFPLLASPGTTPSSAPSYSFNASTDTGLLSQATGTLALATTGTARLTIDNSGRIGVGTTTPTSDLQVVGANTSGNSIEVVSRSGVGNALLSASKFGAGGAPYVQLNQARGTSTAATATGVGDWVGAFQGQGYAGNTYVGGGMITMLAEANYSTTSAPTATQFHTTAVGSTVPAERMRLSSSGYLGIGTQSPQAGLDVATTGTGASAIIVPRDTTANRPSVAVNGMLRYNSQTNKFEAFENNAWLNMIASGGGTTSFPLLASPGTTPSSAPSYAFSGSANTGLFSQAAGTLALATAGTARATIDGSGNLGIGTQFPNNKLNLVGNNAPLIFEIDNNSSTTAQYPGINIVNYAGATLGEPIISLFNFRGNSTTSAALNTGDSLGTIYFAGGTSATGGYVQSTAIASHAEQNFSSGAGGASLQFYTTNLNASTTSEKLHISANGLVGIGTSAPGAMLDVTSNGTAGSAIIVPRDTTANRPSSPVNGMIRYNNSVSAFEGYSNGAWGNLAASGTASAQWSYGTSAQIYYSSANVGIRTSSPSASLEINGASDGSFDPSRGLLVTGGSYSSSISAISVSTGGKYSSSSNLGSQFSIIGVNAKYDSTSDTLKRVGIFGNWVNSQAITMNADSVQIGGNRMGFWTGVGGDPSERMSLTAAGYLGLGSSNPQAGLDVATTGTGGSAIIIPRDTTANRPSVPVNGMIRYNSSTSAFEGYANGLWGGLASGGTSPAQWTYGTAGQIYYNSGFVGIGTTSPTVKLDVGGTIASTSGAFADSTSLNSTGIAFLRASGISSYIDSNTVGNSLTFRTSNVSAADTNAMTINANGWVGLGTSSAAQPLDVTAGAGGININSTTGTNPTRVQLLNTGGTMLFGRESSVGGSLITPALPYAGVVNMQDAHGFHIGTSNVARLSVDATGNVGVGITAPWTDFMLYRPNAGAISSVVSDNTSSTAARYPMISVKNFGGTGTSTLGTPALELVNLRGNSTTAQVLQSGDALGAITFGGATNAASAYRPGADIRAYATENYGTTSTAGALVFSTTGTGSTSVTERMRIDSLGRIGVGTLTPQAALDVTATGSIASAIIVPRDTTAARPSTAVNGMIRYNTSNSAFEGFSNGGWSGLAAASGTMPVSGGGTGNTSQAYVALTDAATVTWTVAGLINNATVTLAGSRTLAFSGLQNGMTGTLIITQGGTGSYTLALPSQCTSNKVVSGGGGSVALSTAVGAIDIITFTYDGTNCYWTYGKNYN